MFVFVIFRNKIKVAFVFLVLVCSVLGSSLYLTFSLLQHKQNCQANIGRIERTKVLKLSQEDWAHSKMIQKLEASEICYFGKMFDIQRITFTKDSVFVYGLFDQKEDLMLTSIFQNSSSTKHILPLITFVFFEELKPVCVPLQTSILFTDKIKTLAYQDRTLSSTVFIEAPPPRQFVA